MGSLRHGLAWLISSSFLLTASPLVKTAAAADAAAPAIAMPKPKKKKEKEPPPKVIVDACKTSFEEEPVPKDKRKSKPSQRVMKDADDPIAQAGLATDPQTKLTALKAAQDALFDSLKKDPYNTIATAKLASVYAMAGRRKCAKALLERLATLRDVKEFEADAKRAINTVRQDPSFEPMRAEANRAVE